MPNPDFTSPYTFGQRKACADAFNAGLKPASAVVGRAARGELADGAGSPLEPFTPSEENVRAWARTERERDAGTAPSPLSGLTTEQATDSVRQRLTNALHWEVERITDAQRREPTGAKRDDPGPTKARANRLESLRQAARALRELDALDKTGPKSRPAPRGPEGDSRAPVSRATGSDTTGGLAARILADPHADSTRNGTAPGRS